MQSTEPTKSSGSPTKPHQNSLGKPRVESPMLRKKSMTPVTVNRTPRDSTTGPATRRNPRAFTCCGDTNGGRTGGLGDGGIMAGSLLKPFGDFCKKSPLPVACAAVAGDAPDQ